MVAAQRARSALWRAGGASTARSFTRSVSGAPLLSNVDTRLAQTFPALEAFSSTPRARRKHALGSGAGRSYLLWPGPGSRLAASQPL